MAQKQIEERAKMYKPLKNYSNQLKFNSLPYEIEIMAKDNSLKEKRQRWHESLSKDIYVEEALNVLDDLQGKPIVKKPMNAKLKDGKLVKS
jgi:carboxyl-terminal processing protease